MCIVILFGSLKLLQMTLYLGPLEKHNVFVSSVYKLMQCLICLLTVSTKSQSVTSPSGKMLMLLVVLALVTHLEKVFWK